MPVPSPARAGSEAECAGWRVTSRQEKPVSMGLLFDGLQSSGFLPCAGLSRLICRGKTQSPAIVGGKRPWRFYKKWVKKMPD